jgi:hypothetical protein
MPPPEAQTIVPSCSGVALTTVPTPVPIPVPEPPVGVVLAGVVLVGVVLVVVEPPSPLPPEPDARGTLALAALESRRVLSRHVKTRAA